MKPVIGISANYRYEIGEYRLKDYYTQSVLRAGGIPVILPAIPLLSDIEQYILMCDGFILSGGGDVDPNYWGEMAEKELGEIDPLRDQFEIKLTELLFLNRKPLLGICRGCQIINVAAGGSLIQDIKGNFMHQQEAPRDYGLHHVFIEKDSKLAGIIQSEQIVVNTFHHQAVNVPGQILKIAACSADGTIEAVEANSESFVLGVQWHPECMNENHAYNLFKALVEAAGRSTAEVVISK